MGNYFCLFVCFDFTSKAEFGEFCNLRFVSKEVVFIDNFYAFWGDVPHQIYRTSHGWSVLNAHRQPGWTDSASFLLHTLGSCLTLESTSMMGLSQWGFVLSSNNVFQFLSCFTEVFIYFFMFWQKFINRFKMIGSIKNAYNNRYIYIYSRVLYIYSIVRCNCT